MSTTNDVTGDSLTSKASTKKYRDNYDNIFKTSKEEIRPESGKMCIPQLNGITMACIKYEDFKKHGYDEKYMWIEKDNIRFPITKEDSEDD